VNASGESTAPKRGWRSLHRLAPVRFLVFFVVLIAGYVGAQFALRWAFHNAPVRGADWVMLGASIALAAALIGIYVALVHGMERRKATEVSPGADLALAGIVFGLVLFVTVLGLIHVAGSAELLEMPASFDAAPALAAAIFGLVHALNPGATVVSTAAIAIEGGLLLAAAYALIRNLWLPIGLHFGWNFTEGGIFGASVSGAAAGKCEDRQSQCGRVSDSECWRSLQ
jgi:membrane protease YdiL (CAAX protease family)